MNTTEALGRLGGLLRFLREKVPTVSMLSIQWSVVRHPLHPVQRDFLREEAQGRPRRRRRPWEGLKLLPDLLLALGVALRSFGQVAVLRWLLRHRLREIFRQPFDLVIKSWSFGPDPPAPDQDFYFGNLQSRAKGRGFRSVLISSDVRAQAPRRFASAFVSSQTPCRIPEECLIPLGAPFRLLSDQVRSALRLLGLAFSHSDPGVRSLSLLAARESLSPYVSRMGLLFWAAEEAGRRWHPRGALTLYEGAGWEKLFFWGVKRTAPQCRTVGYQHTVLFPESLSILRPGEDLDRRTAPDLALCLGELPLQWMEPGHTRRGIPLIPFGTFRAFPDELPAPAQVQRRTVLVTPEGIRSEAEGLFSFAIQCARACPDWIFLLRSHPELPTKSVLDSIPGTWPLPGNVRLSEGGSIQKDFEEASHLLVRGSSSVLYAIANGLQPVHLEIPGEINTDPLTGLTVWRRGCSDLMGWKALLVAEESLGAQERGRQWQEACRYVKRYAMPVGEAQVRGFLEAIR
ncbi:MAG: hypothetical protein HYZ90_01295 [Candidatus Omnitrophica bacterium]|nr:hypothetical protein [Candidatus Omnitrophota bacterium]